MAAPTIEELQILTKFRAAISDLDLRPEEKTDLNLLRWLRARDLNLTNAESMLRKSLEWRKEVKLDEILTWEPPEHYKTEYIYEIVGRDSQNRPIIIFPLGDWDMRKAVTSGESKILFRYLQQLFAKLFEKMRLINEHAQQCDGNENNVEVTQFNTIVDFGNFSMKQLSCIGNIQIIKELITEFESNYPETLHVAYVINASRIFSMLYAIVKPFLSPRTADKIKIYTSPSKWQPVLLENFPRDQLPLELGGTRGGRRISMGAILDDDIRLIKEIPQFVTVDIGAGENLVLEYTVKTSGSKISWKFKTESNDIGFSICFEKNKVIELYRRVECHSNEEVGEIICEEAGEYFIAFDNTYSRMRSKTLHYSIEILENSDIFEEEY